MPETSPHRPTESHLTFRDRVIRQADEQARLYLYGEARGQRVTREQKEVIEGIVATDYDGRTVIELLQNGHDAHSRVRHDGALEVVLYEDEGAHGVLYVANAGSPVDHDDFEAICSLGLSNKRPDEGIGNKGVGFKSVLQLADSPEIYSASRQGSGRFDGYGTDRIGTYFSLTETIYYRAEDSKQRHRNTRRPPYELQTYPRKYYSR